MSRCVTTLHGNCREFHALLLLSLVAEPNPDNIFLEVQFFSDLSDFFARRTRLHCKYASSERFSGAAIDVRFLFLSAPLRSSLFLASRAAASASSNQACSTGLRAIILLWLSVNDSKRQMVLWLSEPTPGNFNFPKALPTSFCVTPNLMRRCLKCSAKASSSRGSQSASGWGCMGWWGVIPGWWGFIPFGVCEYTGEYIWWPCACVFIPVWSPVGTMLVGIDIGIDIEEIWSSIDSPGAPKPCSGPICGCCLAAGWLCGLCGPMSCP